VIGKAAPPRRPALEYGIAIIGMFVVVAIVRFIPVVGQTRGLAILTGFVAVAMIVRPAPALAGMVVGAVGIEFIRPEVTMAVHVQRVIAFGLLGGAIVAIAYSRRAKFDAVQQYRLLFEQHPLPMWLFDEDSLAFITVNDAAINSYGYTAEDFARLSLLDLLPAQDLADFEKRPWSGQPEHSMTARHRTKDGRIIGVFIRSRPVPVEGRRVRLVLVEDVTERRLLEVQLQQAQKMDAVGQLAGGIAHDFNNLLTAIQGYATLLSDSFQIGDGRRNDVREINRAAERAAELTRQLLAFSRKQMFELRVLTVSAVVDEMAPMLRRLVDETIEVTTTSRARGRVKADPAQLQQVLLNLVMNARDAMAGGRGRITVETSDLTLDGTYAQHHAATPAGPYVMLAVSDTGHGMDAATQARIFEPFFTTKPQGRGTGLGLATVYGIVKQSGGHVWVYSEVGCGTTFKIYLPATGEIAEVPSEGGSPVPPHSAARVLLLEDEDGVRRLVTKVLERRGYVVHATGDPAEALALAERRDVKIDLLLTDVVLPGMSGRAVADAVETLQPACRILFMSGYTDDAVVRHGVLHAEARFLQKPFRADALVQKVAEALAG